MKELQLLDLKSNELAELPAEMGQLKMCTKIDLSHNMLTVPPPPFFSTFLPLLSLFLLSSKLLHLVVYLGNLQRRWTCPMCSRHCQTLLSLLLFSFSFSLGATCLWRLIFPDIPPFLYLSHLSHLFHLFQTLTLKQELPWEMANLSSLNILEVSHNPLIIPPRPVVNKGTQEILGWLKNNEKQGRKSKTSGLGQKKKDEEK